MRGRPYGVAGIAGWNASTAPDAAGSPWVEPSPAPLGSAAFLPFAAWHRSTQSADTTGHMTTQLYLLPEGRPPV